MMPGTSKKPRPIALVAMGGHAFIAKGEAGTIHDHERNAAKICQYLMTLVEREYNLIITHGNGPQVGNLLLKNELAKDEVLPMPLDILVANTEGSLGYILQQAMLNELRKRNIRRYVVTVVSQVIVDQNDPAFVKPTKPIGPFLSQEEAEKRRDTLDWNIVEDAGRGWRRVVPSPHPQKIVQRHTIRDVAQQGHIVIACGGGGIPIIQKEDGSYEGVEAVIDKDLTSSILAYQAGAELIIILTSVPKVYLNFNTPEQRALSALTIGETVQYINEGHFAPGSMGPKVEAILDFLKAGGKRGLITSPALLSQAMDGLDGTHFIGRV
ncbi:carbamate kinase [candidate division CSSED10-310 bacterium]|uniref:Carbamate kinase n=1 Tax=candidate division CSSED10-310 bacterium TaxID=2855610 RepID=A0ABV6YRB8_UNCC1